MKKAKSVLSVLAIVVAAVAVLFFVLVPVADYAIAVTSKQVESPALDFAGVLGCIGSGIGGLFSDIGSAFSPFNFAHVAAVVLAGLVLALAVVAIVLCAVKKSGKSIGFVVPVLLLGVFAALLGGVALIPAPFFNVDEGGVYTTYVTNIRPFISTLVAVVCFLGAALGFTALLLTVIYAALVKAEKTAKEGEVEEKVVEEVASKPVTEETVVAAEKAPEAVTKEVPSGEEPVKVVRRILVHRSGKVVRVLNEHYYDVTTNIYVEPGYVDASVPTETEQEHYEKIINASKEKAPAPAPVVAPAPAPVSTPEVAPAPAPEKVKVERIPFAVRLKQADKGLKAAYNEIKSEILSYGIKSRISLTGDTFRLHTKTYVKIVVAGKSLKLYFALDPKAYKDSTFPIGDASGKILHVDTPLVFKVKSDLSIRRAKSLIADCAAKDGLVQGEVVAFNHAKEVK